MLYVTEGKPYKQIAPEVGISVSRTKQIMSAIFRLMDVRGIVELAFEMGKHWKEIEGK